MASPVKSVESLRESFLFFAATQCRGRSAVYETLSEGVAGDDSLLDLLLTTPKEQRRPSLLFAAVNSLLSAEPDAELRRYYPIHGGQRPVDDNLVTAFSAFCAQHHDALHDLLVHRSTQTNEIRRCFALRVGLAHLTKRWPGPISLVEIGASAGLNLLFDRYTYRTDGVQVSNGAATDVVVSCEVRGTPAHRDLLADTPAITQRLGLDQHPVDLTDPEARRWLEAFIWPEQLSELTTLRAAIEMSLSSPDSHIIQGDAVTDTARLLAELPGDEPVLVFTASLLTYLSPGQRKAFVGQLHEAAQARRVGWIFGEAPGLVATTDVTCAGLAGPLAKVGSVFAVGASLRDHGWRDDRVLALADPYLRWLAPARTAEDDFSWAKAEGLC